MEYGSLYVVVYVVMFYYLFCYATQLLGIEDKRIQLFVKGLNTDIQVLSIYLDSVRKTFNEVFYYVQ